VNATNVALSIVLGSSLSCATAAVQHGGPSRPERWSQLDTPHFAISTNLEAAPAEKIARSLEQLRASLLALAWTGAPEPLGRTPVVVFARPAEFQRQIGRSTLAGITITRSDFERTLSFTPGGANGVPPVAVHELVHDLSPWFMPIQPRWFAEGLAEYLATVRFDPDTEQATMGESSTSNIKWLLHTKVFIRSAQLFAQGGVDSVDPREQASFYASSWLLVHYLLHEQPDAFGQFQVGLTRLVPWQEAWRAAFPALPLDRLDDQVMEYVRKNRFLTRTDHVEAPRFEIQERVLTDAERHGVLARLSFLLALPLGEQEAREALRLDPNELNALVTQFHSLRPDMTEARLELVRRATTAHPDSGEAWLLAAQAAPSRVERADALARAARLAPHHPLTARLLAAAELESGRAREALRHTTLALRRSPLRPDVLALHVAALAARHRCSTAQALSTSADTLFPSSCTVHLEAREVACSEYVRLAWSSAGRCNEGRAQLER
jgi:hypothetical protein